MTKTWIALNDIPAEGREFSFSDQSLWTGPMEKFKVGGRIGQPMEASLLVVPQDDGWLVTGRLTGSVILPCDVCAEEFEQAIDEDFDSFETLDMAEGEFADECRVREEKGVPRLDAGGLLWEQLMLALPTRPECRPGCKGLCPTCGINRNTGACSCSQDEGDPRLAVLRKLKLS